MNKEYSLRNKLIEENLGLVYSCANRFRGRGVEYDDLFQAGCVGLLKAAEGFDETRGFAFSTYAVPAILGEIRRIFRDGGAVKVGRSAKEKARALLKSKEELTSNLDREPTVNELAEFANYSVSETAELLCAALPPLSLTSESDEEQGQIDIPIDAIDEGISDRIALMESLKTLNERDRKLIELRYYKGCTQSVTAKALGMSQVQVSRREKAILTHLKEKLNA